MNFSKNWKGTFKVVDKQLFKVLKTNIQSTENI